MTLLLLAYALGGTAALLGSILPGRARVGVTFTATGVTCVVALVAASHVLLSGQTATFHSEQILPFTGVDLTLDPLGALFIAIAAIVGFAASGYALGYARGALASRTAMASFALFVTSLILVPAAASVTTFLLTWELMALTSTLLLLLEHRHGEATQEATIWYAAMTHGGAVAILLGLVLLADHTGGQTFAAIALRGTHVSPALRSVGFLLILVGCSSKAGAVPFHVWLPRAHAEAPAPVSALMSGAMVNLGIYGIIRVGAMLLGGGYLWWWLLVVALGVLSALYGALHAAASSDLKRLLACSTIDNLGLVLIAVGVAGALRVEGLTALAALATVAAFFHLINHSLFKGTLFLGAGAVERASGTRDLDELGGLVRRMPATAAFFGLGALAISAVPGLNGFASEWLLFEALLHGFATNSVAVLVALLVSIAALALTAGVTAAAFVKAFGIGFLGQPRSTKAASAQEVAPSMVCSMGLLALPCVALGLVPGLLSSTLLRLASVTLGQRAPAVLAGGTGLELARGEAAITPLLLAATILAALLLTWTLVKMTTASGARRAEAWGCGRERQTARMEYSATSFAEPLGRVFDDVLRPDHDVEVSHLVESRYFPAAITYRTRLADGFERYAYSPLVSAITAWGRVARRLQNGSVHRYLGLGFAALVIVLLALA